MQLRELYLEPWFDVDGFRKLRQSIFDVMPGWNGNELRIKELTSGQLVDKLMQLVDELHGQDIPDGDTRWERLRELDAAIVISIGELLSVSVGQ